MKKLVLILFISCFGITVWAQKERARLKPEEFRAKQEAFITQKADLTKDEAAKFFPAFFELQNKKKELNDKALSLIKKGKDDKTTENEYDKIIEQVLDLRIESDKLEKEYYKRFRKVLSAKKLYKVQYAEMRFHRELLKGANHQHQGNKPDKKK